MEADLRPGAVLLSAPRMLDANFENTVVMLCAYSADEGALGVILNRPLDLALRDLLQPGHPFEEPYPDVQWGGPVSNEQLHSLAGPPYDPASMLEVLPGLYFGGALDQLGRVREEGNPLRFFLGYSGWSPGQLEEEMQQDAWRVISGAPENAFDPEPTTLWQRLIARVEPDLAWLRNYPSDPTVN